jgi:hypothetical protein
MGGEALRLRIRRLVLVGTRREISFEPGLNVIHGPISTGKSALMRLLRIALGGDYEGISPEVDAAVDELAAELVLGDEQYAVRRRMVRTPTASVEVAGEGDALVLPAMRARPNAPLSYGDWLLEKLGLPRLEVPAAPTRPADSAFIPVTINDYLRYCRLTQEEIDVDVLGSSMWFKDHKRRIVFRILYGSFDADVARLQQRLRDVQTELRALRGDETAFARFLEGTAFASRVAIERELQEAEDEAARLARTAVDVAAEVAMQPEAQELRTRLIEVDTQLSELRAIAERERRAARDLTELRNQLQTQSGRLTRAIVAGEAFFDFELRTCPRCGNAVATDRASNGECYLCLQPEPVAQSREDLVREQARVNLQIAETEELIAAHEETLTHVTFLIKQLEAQRSDDGARLDYVLATFVSDSAEQNSRRAAQEAATEANIRRLRDYLGVFEHYDAGQQRIEELERESERLQMELERSERVDAAAEERILTLEQNFANLVDAVDIPRFSGMPRAAIDRSDYQPIVNGRKLPGLSAGVRVLVNVAHILAHHLTASDVGIPLPGVLLIDGMTKNIGTAEYDAERINNVWTQLIELDQAIGNELQVIVAVNDIPERINPYVRLRLDEGNRLIPAEDLR